MKNDNTMIKKERKKKKMTTPLHHVYIVQVHAPKVTEFPIFILCLALPTN
jgi:hypothetical protein